MGGSKTVFGEGFYGMFSPSLSFPPPLFFSDSIHFHCPAEMSRRFATRIGAIRMNQFVNRLAEKNPRFSQRASDSRESPQTCDSQFLAPRSAIRKKVVQFRNPEMIRENQAIRANLRIDSRESGHLSCPAPQSSSYLGHGRTTGEIVRMAEHAKVARNLQLS